MKIIVGSKNPKKIQVVVDVAEQMFDNVEVGVIDVSSDVAEQPMSLKEGLLGAKNRAKNALESGKGDMGIGIESFVQKVEEKWFVGGAIVALHKDGTEGVAFQSYYELPEWASKEITNENSLGKIMGKYLGDEKIGQKGGTVEIVSSGLVDRHDLMLQPLAYAFGRFVKKEFYKKEEK